MNMKKGVLYGLISGITWAVNALLLYNVLNLYAANYGDIGSFHGWMLILTCALTIALTDAVLAFLAELVILWRMQKLGEFWRVLFSRDSLGILPAALCSGVLATLPYTIASSYNSPLALTMSTAFPAIGALFAVLWFKEKLTKFKFFGIIVTILGVAIMTGLGESVPWFVYLIAILPAFGYAFEGLFGYRTMRADVHPEVTTVMRRAYIIVVFLLMLIVTALLAGDLGYIWEVLQSFTANADVFPFLSGLVGNVPVIWIIFFIGSSASAVSYAAWYYSMTYGGVGTAQTLNITYSAFLVLLLALPPFCVMPGLGSIAGVVVILIGACIVTFESIKSEKA